MNKVALVVFDEECKLCRNFPPSPCPLNPWVRMFSVRELEATEMRLCTRDVYLSHVFTFFSLQFWSDVVLDFPVRFGHHMAGYLKSPAPPGPPHHQYHPPHPAVPVPGLAGPYGLSHALDPVGFQQGECHWRVG
jgi:hypothetical protein